MKTNCLRTLMLMGFFLALSACSESEEPAASGPVEKDAAVTESVSAASTAGLQLQALEWRNIGPFNGGRGTTVVGHPTDQKVFYFGHGSGGLWKTEDAGPTGAGRRRASSTTPRWAPWPSTRRTRHHVRRPRRAAAAPERLLGRRHVQDGRRRRDLAAHRPGGLAAHRPGPHPSRQPGRRLRRVHGPRVRPNRGTGVFRTKDGGETWEKVLFKNEGTGAIDLVMSPDDPNLLFAALWEFERKAWGAKTGGPDGGIWRSRDGGDTWEEITQRGHARGHDGPHRPDHVRGGRQARLRADRLGDAAGPLSLR